MFTVTAWLLNNSFNVSYTVIAPYPTQLQSEQRTLPKQSCLSGQQIWIAHHGRPWCAALEECKSVSHISVCITNVTLQDHSFRNASIMATVVLPTAFQASFTTWNQWLFDKTEMAAIKMIIHVRRECILAYISFVEHFDTAFPVLVQITDSVELSSVFCRYKTCRNTSLTLHKSAVWITRSRMHCRRQSYTTWLHLSDVCLVVINSIVRLKHMQPPSILLHSSRTSYRAEGVYWCDQSYWSF